MRYDEGADLECAYQTERSRETPPEHRRPLFEARTVSGRAVSARHAEALFANLTTTRLFLVTVVHVVGVPSPTGGSRPIVEQSWVDALFRTANDIWSQACIELVPHSTGILVTGFRDIGLSAFAGLCLAPEQLELVEPHDVKAPGTLIVNVYLVDDTNGIACGSPVSGRVFLPTAGRSPESMGRTFAHEIGHVLLNPLGVDDSDDPDHLMFHPQAHPDTPAGSRDGLFLSDCLGARNRAKEELFSFARPGGFGGLGGDSEPVVCRMSPRLGNNLAIVATHMAPE